MFRAYEHMLSRRPLLVKTTTGMVLGASGDFTAQRLEGGATYDQRRELARTARPRSSVTVIVLHLIAGRWACLHVAFNLVEWAMHALPLPPTRTCAATDGWSAHAGSQDVLHAGTQTRSHAAT